MNKGLLAEYPVPRFGQGKDGDRIVINDRVANAISLFPPNKSTRQGRPAFDPVYVWVNLNAIV